MDDLARQLEQARPHLEPEWDNSRVESNLIGVHRRLRRRRQIRIAAVGACTISLLAGVAVVAYSQLLSPSATNGQAATIAATPPLALESWMLTQPAPTIRFIDGSTATALGDESELVASEVSATNIRVRLESGAARFDVTPRPERLFQVDAGEVSVLVLGTAFSVERREERVAVAVRRGRVRVAWRGGARVITAGETGLFPPQPPLAVDGGSTPEPRGGAAGRPAAEAPSPARPPRGGSWQTLAEQGRFPEAYDAMQAAGGAGVVRGMDEALLAADAARLSGHPAQAAQILDRAIAAHPGDPRTSVASFTVGRVLLNQVGRPRAAAQAFARARRMAPGGALAEDALAREVEAWSRAGAADTARQRARSYVQRYPRGRRLRAVRRHGGLE